MFRQTAPSPPERDFDSLDRHIVSALAEVRRARLAAQRSRSIEAVRTEERAESRLNALLEYRFTGGSR